MDSRLACMQIITRPKKTFQMQIPVFSVYSPSGENEYLFTTLSDSQCNLILKDAKSGLKQKVTDNLVSPFLGLTFRSQDIQIFSFVSCTGWLLIVGFENGPFNGSEVCYYFSPFKSS